LKLDLSAILPLDVDALIQDIGNTFASNIQNSNLALSDSSDMVSRSMVRDYGNQEKLVDQYIKDADNLTAFVTGIARQVNKLKLRHLIDIFIWPIMLCALFVGAADHPLFHQDIFLNLQTNLSKFL
jgi:hypothetical protein